MLSPKEIIERSVQLGKSEPLTVLQEFKNFAVKGNVIDMAVGVIIGTAFGKIVSSFVTDVIMPPIGVLIGGVDFSKLAFTLKSATDNAPAVMISYGKFIQTVVDFAIIAGVIFMVIKIITSTKQNEDAPPALSTQEQLLTEIRDLLKK